MLTISAASAMDAMHGRCPFTGSLEETTRDLSHELHPAIVGYIGLPKALEELCNDIATRKSVQVNFYPLNATRPPADVALCVYRVAQEALQNSVRHSGASLIAVTLEVTAEHTHMSIADNGVGSDAATLLVKVPLTEGDRSHAAS